MVKEREQGCLITVPKKIDHWKAKTKFYITKCISGPDDT